MPKTRLKILAAVACCLTPLGYLGAIQIQGNFHSVVKGVIYRSAQPSAADITDDAKHFGIKSIINLRGENIGQSWYDNELNAARTLGIQHIDFRMSASKELTDAQVSKLADLMKNTPKPVLIHCKSGADRTGLASAIYLSKLAKQDVEVAEGQLSFRYGHIGIPYLSAAYPMDMTWDRIEKSQSGS